MAPALAPAPPAAVVQALAVALVVALAVALAAAAASAQQGLSRAGSLKVTRLRSLVLSAALPQTIDPLLAAGEILYMPSAFYRLTGSLPSYLSAGHKQQLLT